MSANALKAVLLEDASTEDKQQFAGMLAKACAQEDLDKSGHRCWMFVPRPNEYAIMAKYAKDDKCPKCGKGRIVLEVYKGNFGDNYWLKCYFNEGCDYRECATLPEEYDL